MIDYTKYSTEEMRTILRDMVTELQNREKRVDIDFSNYTREELENTKWLDIVNSHADRMQLKLEQLWMEHIHEPQMTYTGRIDMDFSDVLALSPEDTDFHPRVRTLNGYSLHEGCTDNKMGRYVFPKDHWLLKKLCDKFGLTKAKAELFLQRPANMVGVHYDKYGKHVLDSGLDFSNTLTKELYRGVIFCTDWQVGQVFLCGTEALTQWKKGDTYTFPWYMPHGSANASDKERYLVRFLGELTKK